MSALSPRTDAKLLLLRRQEQEVERQQIDREYHDKNTAVVNGIYR